MAEFEERLHHMMREREELIESAQAVQRKLREIGEGRPDAAAELRDHLQRIEREVHELDAALQQGRMRLVEAQTRRRIEELKHKIDELSEAGRHDEAEHLKLQGRQIMAVFEEQRRRMAEGDRPRPEHGDRPRPEQGDVERRMHHLRAAMENLRAAGMHEAAQRLAEQAEQFMREHRHDQPPTGPDRPRPEHMDRPPEHGGPQVEQLRREVHQLREEMQEIREHLRRLVEREK